MQKKGNGNFLERPRTRLPDELAIRRRRDAVRNLQRTDTEHDVRIQGCNRESGLRIHPDKTKILSNESSMNSDTKRYIKIVDMSIEILAKNESVRYLGQRISINKRHWKSKAGSEQLGRHSTNTDRNQHRRNTCSNSAFDSSTPRSLRLFATLLEHGHRAENTKE